MNELPVRVIKVGGSLLTFDELENAFRQWLAAQPTARNVVLVGGGEMADVVRAADVRFKLGDEACHELCLQVLGVSSRLFAAILQRHEPDSVVRLWDNFSELRLAIAEFADSQTSHVWICDPRNFVRTVEQADDGEPLPPPISLPHSWEVTSDSIALRLAIALTADELVLLKSNSLPNDLSMSEAVAAGFIDRHFPNLASGKRRMRYVNLRDANWAECELRS